MKASSPMYPHFPCPDPGCAGRMVRVAPTAQRIYPHNLPSGDPCPANGRQVDLYGTAATNGGDH